MDEIKKHYKQHIDISPEDAISYLNRKRPRVILSGVAFVLQFYMVWCWTTGYNWKDKYGVTKMFTLFYMVIWLSLIEVIRYSDFALKKWLPQVYQMLGGTDDGGKPSGALAIEDGKKPAAQKSLEKTPSSTSVKSSASAPKKKT